MVKHKRITNAPAATSEVWLTTEEAAKKLNLTERGLEKYRALDEGPPYRKIGKGKSSPVRYPEHLLIEWMKSQTLVNPQGIEAA